MNVGFMQRVDYWVGVPLCALLSIFFALARMFRSRRESHGDPPRRVLLVELSEMGSAILAYSLIERLKEHHGADVYFLIFERNRESVDLLSTIPPHNVLTLDDRSFIPFAVSTLRMLLKLRTIGIDTVVDLELFSRCTALITALSGARRRVGFERHTHEGLYRGNFLTHPVLYNPHQHMVLNFLALGATLEGAPGEYPAPKADVRPFARELPVLAVTAAERERMREILAEAGIERDGSRLVFLNPDPGDLLLRGWGIERYAELVDELADGSATFVVVGLPRARIHFEALRRALPAARIHDCTGRTRTVRELAVLLTCADLFITNDSGPAHVASLTRTRQIVLFGPETPALYGPLGESSVTIFAGLACSPCYAATNHRRTCCTDNRCMQAIQPTQVAQRARMLLERAPVSARSEMSPSLRTV